jgi:hypothetical protein
MVIGLGDFAGLSKSSIGISAYKREEGIEINLDHSAGDRTKAGIDDHERS